MINNIIIKTAKDNNPVPIWNEFQLHSLYEPQKEGIAIAEKFLNQISDFDKPLLVLGLGFAYHIIPLLDKFKEIFIAESCQELISEAKEIDMLKSVFNKCQIIDNLSEAPYIPDYHLLVLRSESRFQEKFFTDVQNAVKSINKNSLPAFNQVRVLVNSPVYGGSYTISKYAVSALESLGVCVRLCDHSVAEGLLMKYLKPVQHKKEPQKDSEILIEQLNSLLTETLWQDIKLFKPHIVLFLAQSPFDNKLLKEISKAEITTMYWFVEEFRRFTYWKEVCNNFDYFFMIQKGDFENELKKVSKSSWGWLPVAADPKYHKPIKLSIEDKDFYGSDTSFMGAAYPNRIKFFKGFKKINLKLWGTGWSDKDFPSYNLPLKDQRITIEQSNKIYQATKININLHSTNENDIIFDQYGDFVNPRTFEIAACGGFQMVDDREAVRELFVADKEIVYFSTLEEAEDKVSFYLKNDDLRQKIARAGCEKTLKLHTYKIRLEQMLKIAFKNSPLVIKRLLDEETKLKELYKMINDKEMEKIINSIEPAMRTSYSAIMDKIKNTKGDLKKHEAIALLLDTFYTGE